MFRVLGKIKKQKHVPFTISHLPLTGKAQVILEFTFCMIVVMLMLYGITKVMVWTGRDYAGRNLAHDATLTTPIDRDYGGCTTWVNGLCTGYSAFGDGPIKQIDSYFYTPVKMDAIFTDY